MAGADVTAGVGGHEDRARCTRQVLLVEARVVVQLRLVHAERELLLLAIARHVAQSQLRRRDGEELVADAGDATVRQNAVDDLAVLVDDQVLQFAEVVVLGIAKRQADQGTCLEDALGDVGLRGLVGGRDGSGGDRHARHQGEHTLDTVHNLTSPEWEQKHPRPRGYPWSVGKMGPPN